MDLTPCPWCARYGTRELLRSDGACPRCNYRSPDEKPEAKPSIDDRLDRIEALVTQTDDRYERIELLLKRLLDGPGSDGD